MNWDDAGHQLPDYYPNGDLTFVRDGMRCRFCGMLFLFDAYQYPYCTFQAQRFYAQYGLSLRSPILPGYQAMIQCTAQPDEIMLSIPLTCTTLQVP